MSRQRDDFACALSVPIAPVACPDGRREQWSTRCGYFEQHRAAPCWPRRHAVVVGDRVIAVLPPWPSSSTGAELVSTGRRRPRPAPRARYGGVYREEPQRCTIPPQPTAIPANDPEHDAAARFDGNFDGRNGQSKRIRRHFRAWRELLRAYRVPTGAIVLTRHRTRLLVLTRIREPTDTRRSGPGYGGASSGHESTAHDREIHHEC